MKRGGEQRAAQAASVAGYAATHNQEGSGQTYNMVSQGSYIILQVG